MTDHEQNEREALVWEAEVVERVARAIFGVHADPDQFDDERDAMREWYRDYARAALTATLSVREGGAG